MQFVGFTSTAPQAVVHDSRGHYKLCFHLQPCPPVYQGVPSSGHEDWIRYARIGGGLSISGCTDVAEVCRTELLCHLFILDQYKLLRDLWAAGTTFHRFPAIHQQGNWLLQLPLFSLPPYRHRMFEKVDGLLRLAKLAEKANLFLIVQECTSALQVSEMSDKLYQRCFCMTHLERWASSN